MSEAPVPRRWRILLTPRWISWHLFAVLAVAGMCWLGAWQFGRAMAGNTLSWAYTFEWPIFAIFGVFFWVKTIRDELHPAAEPGERGADMTLPTDQAAELHADAPARADQMDGEQALAKAGAAQQAGVERGDAELAEYNAYLAKLSAEVKGHGRWHGLRQQVSPACEAERREQRTAARPGGPRVPGAGLLHGDRADRPVVRRHPAAGA